jgi:hypothetical protein
METTRTYPAPYLLLLLVFLVAAGCTGNGNGEPSTVRAKEKQKEHESYAPIFRLSSSEEVKDRLAARFAQAQVDARLTPIRDLPPEKVPSWARGCEGWVILVKPAQREAAEAVRKQWFQSLREKAEMSGPVRRPRAVPLVLGEAKPVPEEVLASVKGELQKRRKLDQVVRKDPSRHGEMKQVDTDNTTWLKKVVVDHGWIDSRRFGTKAADTAFLLVQHSGDLPLMLAALPEIEKDVRAGRLSAENFAFLFDRVQIMQGGQQRYGTQVIKEGEKGDWVVGRLEDPDRVDERRKEIGLGPLADYLARFGQNVRIER